MGGCGDGWLCGLWIPGREGNFGVGQAVNVKAAAPLTNEDLSKMAVAGVNFAPAADSSGTVQLQVRTEQPIVLSGSVDDADVRRVLTYVVMNGERFDPGVRAVNLLVRSLEGDAPSEPPALGTAPVIAGAQIPPDPSVDRVIRALEGLQQRDPNRYVRLRSAAALRQIGPRETQ